uniref:Uncharacterized protein LOC117361603 n=1 Tax=Geotrypetes seraphini TaxID=260995 RepID=A0A6P8R4Q3_GEOSA|nr:uncharacterized protein LOC117361603 [Geotrypetes seraphini]
MRNSIYSHSLIVQNTLDNRKETQIKRVRREMREMAAQAIFTVFSFLLIRVSLSKLQVIVSESPVKAKVGDDVLLKCQLVVDQPPVDVSQLMIQWFHRGGMILEYDENLNIRDSYATMSLEELQNGNASLILPNIKPNRAGNYRCYVYYTTGSSMKEIVLEIEDPEEQQVCPKGSSPVLNKVDEVMADFHRIRGKLKSINHDVQKCLCSQ